MPVTFKDYYATLGVPRDASDDDIKQAFRNLARKYHPDVAKDKATAEEKFKEINEAQEVLSDPEKRRKYDQLGADWQHAGNRPPPPSGEPEGGQEFHFGGTGFSDFFEQYFSGGSRFGFPHEADAGFGQGRSRPGAAQAWRGADIEGDILVALDEVMVGAVRSISMQTVDRRSGEVETQLLKVRIPPGTTDGSRIRVPGHGEPGHGGAPAGDLFLRVRHAVHPDFRSRDADLIHELDIAPWEAVLGADVAVPTLDGPVNVRIPPRSENGQKLRVRGHGLPKGKTGRRGDLYAILHVQLPSTLGDEERALWEKLRDTSTFRPRPDRSSGASKP